MLKIFVIVKDIQEIHMLKYLKQKTPVIKTQFKDSNPRPK